jgi:hypothetical protein
MKAYQVFEGDFDKHGRQFYELKGTFLSPIKARELANTIIKNTQLYGEEIESITTPTGITYWNAVGWEIITICKIEPIEIIE